MFVDEDDESGLTHWMCRGKQTCWIDFSVWRQFPAGTTQSAGEGLPQNN